MIAAAQIDLQGKIPLLDEYTIRRDRQYVHFNRLENLATGSTYRVWMSLDVSTQVMRVFDERAIADAMFLGGVTHLIMDHCPESVGPHTVDCPMLEYDISQLNLGKIIERTSVVSPFAVQTYYVQLNRVDLTFDTETHVTCHARGECAEIYINLGRDRPPDQLNRILKIVVGNAIEGIEASPERVTLRVFVQAPVGEWPEYLRAGCTMSKMRMIDAKLTSAGRALYEHLGVLQPRSTAALFLTHFERYAGVAGFALGAAVTTAAMRMLNGPR